MSYYAVFNVSTDINPILGEKCVYVYKIHISLFIIHTVHS